MQECRRIVAGAADRNFACMARDGPSSERSRESAMEAADARVPSALADARKGARLMPQAQALNKFGKVNLNP
jgi:hypothetical protein